MPFRSQAQIASLSPEAYGRFLHNNYQLGLHPKTEDAFLVPMRDRYAGTYILGVQGSGKSGLLENLILQDIIMGNAVIVIDPHADLTTNCLAKIPLERVPNVHFFDMLDERHPFGLNIFNGINRNNPIALAQGIEHIRHVFSVVWPEVMSQSHLPRFLHAATIALIDNPGSTLVDMYTFLTNDSFRHRLLQNVRDPGVRQFWQMQYDDLSMSQRYQRVEPLVGRLESLFMGRSLVRNIVGQRETTINFRQAIFNREALLFSLPLKTLGHDARLVGTILTSLIHGAVFSFGDIPEDRRPGLSLYVDEFQEFATSDFDEMFTQGRKFGLRMTVAHQYRKQLSRELQSSTMTARTKICFQTAIEDSRETAPLFMGIDLKPKREDIEPKPVEHLRDNDSPEPIVQTLINWYIRPLKHHKHGNNIEIVKPGFRWGHIPYWMLSVQPPEGNPEVFDPVPELNHLLREVMRTGDANIRIPSIVVYGFANSGRGFYSVFNKPFKGRWLTPDISYPAHLVVDSGYGLHWTRPPENGKEQLYHFLFHLRGTMNYLAAHPISTKMSDKPAEIAQLLTQLPIRHALVRSGTDVGRIMTDQTMERPDEDMVEAIYTNIKVQTIMKYCHQVTSPQSASPYPAPDQPIVPRWEEI